MKIQRLGFRVCAPFWFLLLAPSCGYDFSLKPTVGGDGGNAIDGTAPTGGLDAPQASDGGSSPGVDVPGGADIPLTQDTSPDLPGGTVDAPPGLDTQMEADSAVQPTFDAPAEVPLDVAPDRPPLCGGCCTNVDCPLTAPFCGHDNQCAKCTADQDCAGRSATTCNTATGACVQCTKNSQCGGAAATCDTSTNKCVGCTQRSDCPGTCQACTNGSCVTVKNADDPGKCAGTCDANGECKGKKGQSCAGTTECISGSTCSPDGVCCDRACTGPCEACDVAPSPGTCSVLTSGSQPHKGHAACGGTSPCAGVCGGNSDGSCSFSAQPCGSETCSGTTHQSAGVCQQGTCSMPQPVTCKTGTSCVGTQCACPSGTTDCGSGCANLGSDSKNCGVCGKVCPAGQTCDGTGKCACTGASLTCGGTTVCSSWDFNACTADTTWQADPVPTASDGNALYSVGISSSRSYSSGLCSLGGTVDTSRTTASLEGQLCPGTSSAPVSSYKMWVYLETTRTYVDSATKAVALSLRDVNQNEIGRCDPSGLTVSSNTWNLITATCSPPIDAHYAVLVFPALGAFADRIYVDNVEFQ